MGLRTFSRAPVNEKSADNTCSCKHPYTGIYFIDYQLTQSADRLSIKRTCHDVRHVSPSERMTVMCLIHLSSKCVVSEMVCQRNIQLSTVPLSYGQQMAKR